MLPSKLIEVPWSSKDPWINTFINVPLGESHNKSNLLPVKSPPLFESEIQLAHVRPPRRCSKALSACESLWLVFIQLFNIPRVFVHHIPIKSCPVAIWKKMGVVLHWKILKSPTHCFEGLWIADVSADVPCFQQRSRHIQTYLLNLGCHFGRTIRKHVFPVPGRAVFGNGPLSLSPRTPKKGCWKFGWETMERSEIYGKLIKSDDQLLINLI